eukprot:m.174132 g.174132  ORF g.174132 m.174132 type:complete len:120 (+) comp18321_c0_seq4:276-635(+)
MCHFQVAAGSLIFARWLCQIDVNEPPDAGRNYWAHHKSNPAPFIFPNGSAMVFFSSQDCPKNWPGALAPACIGMAVASTWVFVACMEMVLSVTSASLHLWIDVCPIVKKVRVLPTDEES